MTAAVDPVEGIAFEANPEQRRVIEAGPHDWLLVVAGPGTGNLPRPGASRPADRERVPAKRPRTKAALTPG